MTNESEKNQTPSCACGRGDLYFESLKKEVKDEITDSSLTNQSDVNNRSADNTGKENQ